jgi:cytochrome c oxidase subunit 2
VTVVALFALTSAAAGAAEGKPEDWQLGFQPAATDVAQQMHDFHDLLMVIITVITLFVLALLIWVMVRYNAKTNPTPSKISHNTTVEIVWTVVPVLILLLIAVPSFRLLYAQYDVPPADLTIKATGYQWYWGYEYPDNGGFSFDSILVEQADLQPGQPYLFTVDNEVVVPVNRVVHMLVTSNDVIHNWAMPAFGVKMDAVKGRNSLVWFKVNEPGTYYGHCAAHVTHSCRSPCAPYLKRNSRHGSKAPGRALHRNRRGGPSWRNRLPASRMAGSVRLHRPS